MIAIAEPKASSAPFQWQQGFLKLLPRSNSKPGMRSAIFRPKRENAICEVVAAAVVAYHRLAQRDELQRAYPSSLAKYG